MITEEEFYITPEIEKKTLDYPEITQYNKDLIAESEDIPLLHIAKETIETYTNLSLYLKLIGKIEDFTINCYYYLLHQQELHGADGEQHGIAVELGLEDLKHTLKNYNKRQLIV